MTDVVTKVDPLLTEVDPLLPGATRAARAWPREALAIILAGFVLRTLGFLSNRSLWLDEAYLALNIMERDFRGLLEPLSYAQTAPVGFLFLEEGATLLLGNGERALRLVPLLASLAALPLFWLLARRCLPRGEALVCLGFLAILSPQVYYASEVKQYSLDVTVALVLLLCAVSVLQDDGFRVGRYVLLAVLGAAAVWLSHPVVFVLAGIGSALFLSAGDARRRKAMAAAIGVWAVCFLANYLLFLRGIREESNLHVLWQERFLAWPTSPGAVERNVELLLEPFRQMLGFAESGLPALVFVVGLVALWQRDRRLAWLLAASFLPALLASLLRLYPFASRPILFLSPLFLLFMAAGFGHFWRLPVRNARLVGAVLLLLLLFGPAVSAARHLRYPPQREEMRAVVRYVAQHLEPGDTVWVNHRGQYAFWYYVRYGGYSKVASHNPIIGRGTDGTKKTPRILAEMRSLAGRRRVWVVFSAQPKGEDRIDARALAVSLLDGLGTKLDKIEVAGAHAYLYDLSRAAPVAAR